MAYILSVGTSHPKHHVDQKTAAEFARSQFKRSFKDIDRLLRAFQNGEIESRQFVQPIEWYQTHHSFEEKNNIYLEKALTHAKEAIIHCLQEQAFLKNQSRLKRLMHCFLFQVPAYQPQALMQSS